MTDKKIKWESLNLLQFVNSVLLTRSFLPLPQDDIQIVINQQLKSQQQTEQPQKKPTSNGLPFFRRPSRTASTWTRQLSPSSSWSSDSNTDKVQAPWREWLRLGKGTQYGKWCPTQPHGPLVEGTWSNEIRECHKWRQRSHEVTSERWRTQTDTLSMDICSTTHFSEGSAFFRSKLWQRGNTCVLIKLANKLWTWSLILFII